MRNRLLRATLILLFSLTGLTISPRTVSAQEGHEADSAAAQHAEGEHQEHAEHVIHEKNEIAMFVGGTRRLKFEEDETGLTFGLEYARQLFPRAVGSIAVEWSDGSIERDWIAMVKMGVQPFEDWAHGAIMYIGTGIEVGRVDEVLLEEDEESEVVPLGEHGDEHAEEGEHIETEIDAVMRLGLGWVFHAGSFSIVPNINADIVGEDWAVVGGVTIGYRF
jgi:hypothetical protein